MNWKMECKIEQAAQGTKERKAHLVITLGELFIDALEKIVVGTKKLEGLGHSGHRRGGRLDLGLESLECHSRDALISVLCACNEQLQLLLLLDVFFRL